MSAISSAIPDDYISRVVGYKLIAANFTNQTSNLPQRIAILGEANTANQATIDITPFQFTSAQQVGEKYGYGSPLHQMARILRPKNANLLGAVPTWIYPQLEGTATATVLKSGVTVATTVTETTTHTIVINGRRGLESGRYDYTVTKGESAATVVTNILAAVANVLECPVTGAENTGDIDWTTKWAGVTAAELNISFDTNGTAAGIVYSEVSKVDGTGSVDITPSLDLFQNEWNTIVINQYGSSEFDELEAFNGVPDPTTPTGRYAAEVFKPFVALYGSVLKTTSAVIAVTDATARKSQVTNVHCPAPASNGFSWEAAANMAVTYALIANGSPHLGNGGTSYPDMPIPIDGDIGDFADYINRDLLVKSGSSTVKLNNGVYEVQDFTTTYHPDGETIPKYRYARDINLNWNIEFAWRIIMVRDIQDKTLVGNDQAVRVTNTISPKQAKQLAFSMFADIANRALITDPSFSEANTIVAVNSTNPARLDINFKYKITSTANVVSTDAEFDFSFTL